MYFHIYALRTSRCKSQYELNKIFLPVNNFIHNLQCIEKLVYSLGLLLCCFDALQLVGLKLFVHIHFPWNNLSIMYSLHIM